MNDNERAEVIDMTTLSYTEVGKAGQNATPAEACEGKLRACAYVRQDFEEMAKKWTRPDGQKTRIAGCAEQHGWHLMDTHEDIGWAGDCLNRPGLIAMLAELGFEVLVIDRTDRLACKKEDLDFLLALLDEHGITCVPATWSWEPLAQYMRWWYRTKGNAIYSKLDAVTAKAQA